MGRCPTGPLRRRYSPVVHRGPFSASDGSTAVYGMVRGNAHELLFGRAGAEKALA